MFLLLFILRIHYSNNIEYYKSFCIIIILFLFIICHIWIFMQHIITYLIYVLFTDHKVESFIAQYSEEISE